MNGLRCLGFSAVAHSDWSHPFVRHKYIWWSQIEAALNEKMCNWLALFHWTRTMTDDNLTNDAESFRAFVRNAVLQNHSFCQRPSAFFLRFPSEISTRTSLSPWRRFRRCDWTAAGSTVMLLAVGFVLSTGSRTRGIPVADDSLASSSI